MGSITIGSVGGNISGNISEGDITQTVVHQGAKAEIEQLQAKIERLERAITAQLDYDSADKATLTQYREQKATLQQQLEQLIQQSRATPHIDMAEFESYVDDGIDFLLVIKRKGDHLAWGWLNAQKESGVELNPPQTFSEAEAREFIRAINHQLGAGGQTGQEASNTLQASGQQLAGFIPSAVKTALSQTAQQSLQPPTLLLLTNDIYTPWELAYLPLMAEGPPTYLHCQTIMGRWPLADSLPLPPQPKLELGQMTVVASDYQDSSLPTLNYALAEQQHLQDRYGATALPATVTSRKQLITLRPQAGHLLHCIVHGDSNPQTNNQEIDLADGHRIVAKQLVGDYQAGDIPRFSFIFLNACEVGLPGHSLGQLSGFPGDFLRGGVQGFIAPLWKIHDQTAQRFAEQFYLSTLGNPYNPMTVGQTLHQLRQLYQPQASVTPLGYIFYGHPNLILSMTGNRLQPTSFTSQPEIPPAPVGETISLTGQRGAVTLGRVYTFHAPEGLEGEVTQLSLTESATRSNQKIDEVWAEVVSRLGLPASPVFELSVKRDKTPQAESGPTTRSGEPALRFETPRLAADQPALLLYTDESGIAQWLHPTSADAEKLTFHLPRTIAPPDPTPQQTDTGEGAERGTGTIARAVWRVVAPVVGLPFQAGAAKMAQFLEDKLAPYGWLTLQPHGFEPIDQPDWDTLQQGRTLLMIHGTFSSAKSAFGALLPDTIQKLRSHYEGRIIAFNHPTVHQDPIHNVAWFLEQLPPRVQLELDILTHSRGGLIGREICHRLSHDEKFGPRKVTVHKAVLVAAPNQGSVLASPDHFVDFLNRVTTVSLEDPLIMPMLVGLAGIIAHGTLPAFPGIKSMLPNGAYLIGLNSFTGRETETMFYAIGSKHTPNKNRWKTWLWGSGKEATFDRLFRQDNDLVVPTVGCYQAGHNQTDFHILPQNRWIDTTGRHHINLFAEPTVNQKILEWLTQ